MRETILITGLSHSGKTAFIQQLSQNEAKPLVGIQNFMNNWLATKDGKEIIYIEAPFDWSLPEVVRLQLAHVVAHYHLERIYNENASTVYICSEVGDLDSKRIHQEKFSWIDESNT